MKKTWTASYRWIPWAVVSNLSAYSYKTENLMEIYATYVDDATQTYMP